MKRFIHDETNGLDYVIVGDYYLLSISGYNYDKLTADFQISK